MSTQTTPEAPAAARPSTANLRLEVVVVPVTDVDRAKRFYGEQLGWRLDADFPISDDYRIVQLTPPGSATSIILGAGVTSAAPGSVEGLHLVVDDIEAARAELVDRGIAVSEVFHDATGAFHHAGTQGRVPGPDPQRRSYGSFVSFDDADGNGWILQEVVTRAPGRVDLAATTYGSVPDLAGALRRAATAHGEHERRIGRPDPHWPDWYAEHMVREHAGEELPS